jgi:hypothetical protein
MVPRTRLNEEITKRRELEERIRAFENNPPAPIAPVPQPPEPAKSEIDTLAEQMSAEAGQDEFGNNHLSVQAAKVQLQTMARIQYAQTSGSRLELNVSEFIKKNPSAAIYAEKIKLELSKLPVGVKDNPINVERKFKELRGEDTDRLIAEAEERGKKKALEQKRIVGEAAGETPSGIPDGKSASDMLTADERHFADKNKISHEDYFKSKGNKRV